MRDYILAGSKPPDAWKTGVELELLGYRRSQRGAYQRIDYSDALKVLEAYGGEPIVEGGVVVGTRGKHGSLTLEPGGQLEYSSLPYRTINESQCALINYLAWLREVARDYGFVFIGVGFDPVATLDEQHWVPKPRYSIMKPYLRKRGARSWDMMTRTAATQVNVDFEEEADLLEKLVIGNRLAPIVSAIFANSPFKEGKLTGYKSERLLVWMEMDPDRSGILPAALDSDFSLDRFLESVIETPMFYIQRNGDYVNLAGTPFSDLVKKSGATIEDFATHLTTIFTEARLKQFVELRCTDSGNMRSCLAIEALWKGLLNDDHARSDALRLAPKLGAKDFRQLQYEVARDALDATYDGVNVGTIAKDLVDIARDGLARIAPDEVNYLDEVSGMVISENLSPADVLIGNFQGSWNGRIDKAIDYLAV